MYLFSIINQRIEYKIDIKDEEFSSSTVDRYGIFIETRSFTAHRRVYRIEFNQLEYRQPCATTCSVVNPILWKESKVPNLNGLEIKVQYDSYHSFDGTEVPITIIRKSGNDDCQKPCLVYAYGAYGECLLPRFNLYFLLFVELFNGVLGTYAQINYLRSTPLNLKIYTGIAIILLFLSNNSRSWRW